MRAKKQLGQHFLSDKNILGLMVKSAGITNKDLVLEAGPGRGSLTKLLAEKANKVIAVEKDCELVPVLSEKFDKFKNVEIVEGDIMKMEITPLIPLILKGTNKKDFSNAPLKIRGARGVMEYKIVANIPYYITSHFLRKFLEAKYKPKLMVLMIQREVAERIIAKDQKESLLSLSVKAFGNAKIIRIVPRGAFSPPPKVDSAIIKISDISDSFFIENNIDQKQFFETLRTAFQKKRKMLRQSIGKKIELPEKYQTKRPEELSLTDWLMILKKT